MCKVCLYLMLFVTCYTISLHGQQPIFRNFNVKDRLPSSEVYYVMQDSKGYMWFCTDAGVSRYDGYTFHNYSNRAGLGDNTIFASYEDHKGRIWFRSLSGRLFYFQNDSIYTIPANDKILADIKHAIMCSMYIDEGDTLWCGVSLGQHNYKIAPPYKESDLTYIPIPFGGMTGTNWNPFPEAAVPSEAKTKTWSVLLPQSVRSVNG